MSPVEFNWQQLIFVDWDIINSFEEFFSSLIKYNLSRVLFPIFSILILSILMLVQLVSSTSSFITVLKNLTFILL